MSDEPRDERIADLGFARVDLERAARTGDPEVVYGAGKTPEQVASILATLHERHPERAVLATRLSPAAMDAAAAVGAEVHAVAHAATLGPLPAPRGRVGIVSAGTSDAAVAAEAAPTVAVHGASVVEIRDVGVAGLHRLLAVRDRLEEVDVLIVVAGMEGALPSVVGGLVGTPVIAVPTSVGYGASFGGLAALLGMLNSCAPGVTVVNIDNGYGAGVAAARICRIGHPVPTGTPPGSGSGSGEVPR